MTDRLARNLDLGRKLFLVATGSVAVALGQTQSPAVRGEFEVASVKPSAPGGPDMMTQLSPGLLRLKKYPLLVLIQNAFGARSFEIWGAPAWISSARYDITAKTAGPATADKMWPMLEPLLEDRFRMQVHRERKEMPVYNLSMAKSGKLPPLRAGNCVGSDPRELPPPPAPGKRLLTACGSTLLRTLSARAELYGGRIRMAALVSRLADLLRHPVIDKTGFAGTFDLDLTFAVDESLAGLGTRSPGVPDEPTDPSGLPSLFSALREQLGLKIESTKGSVEVIVIDHIERPSAN
jgi:uncharacterized protein (TIGR03435 family)